MSFHSHTMGVYLSQIGVGDAFQSSKIVCLRLTGHVEVIYADP